MPAAMNPPLRILRANGRDFLGKSRNKTAKEVERETDILNVAEHLMCDYSRADVTQKVLCSSLDITYAAFHRHFADLEELFGKILLRHLEAVFAAVCKTPWDTPDRGPAIRAAYLAYTRTSWGSHTNIHHLYLAHVGTLAPDVAEPVEAMRRMIASTLVSSDAPSSAMGLLDSLELEAPEIEALLIGLQAAAQRTAARRAAARQPPAAVQAAPPPAPTPDPVVELATVRSARAEEPRFDPRRPTRWVRRPAQGSISTVEARAGPA